MSKRPADNDEAGWIPDKLSRKKQKKAKHRLAKGLGTLEECLAVYGAGARVELELKDNSPVLPVHEVQVHAGPDDTAPAGCIESEIG